MDGKWLSILEFATYKKKSISTVRRYIKANRVKYKEENGKYYIWLKHFQDNPSEDEKQVLELKLEMQRLKKRNDELESELQESKMLISLYEQGRFVEESKSKNDLPELPKII